MPSREETPAVDVIIRHLEAEGVDYVFGVPGGPLTPFFEALMTRSSMRFVLAKHEEGAAFMANAYARARRGLGVCVVTSGPGATNALTGIAGAHADSLPVLYVTGQVSTRAFGKGAIQESTFSGVDVVEIFKPVTKMSAMMPNAESAPSLIRQALRLALSGRCGPVHLSMPADVAKTRVTYELLPPDRYRITGGAAPVDRSAAKKAAQLLAAAERPSLLAGHGVALAGASKELVELAELAQIPVATTPKGKGVFPENHPLSLGVFGLGGHLLSDRYFLSDDVLLVVGSSLNEFASSAWDDRLLPSAALIQIDLDPAEIGKNYPVDVAIVGDVRAVLTELTEQLSQLPRRSTDGARIVADLANEVGRHEDAHLLDSNAVPMQPARVVSEIRRALPDRGMLFVDAGNCIMWAGHYFEAREPNTYFIDLGLACMGSAVAGIIGGKLAMPDRPAVALVGDAAFAMHGFEVHTAVENRLDIVWVVLNNGGHGMVVHGERMLRGADLGYASFRVPIDIRAMAASMGARGVRVHTPEELARALSQALSESGPTVIDAIVDGDVVPPTLGRRARSLARFFGAPVANPAGQ